MTSVIDLTERKKSKEESRECEGRYRAVVEEAAECIVQFDVGSKRVLEANIPYQNLLGYTSEAKLRRAVLRSRFALQGHPFLGVADYCRIGMSKPISLLAAAHDCCVLRPGWCQMWCHNVGCSVDKEKRK